MHRPEDGEHVGYLSPDGAPRLLTGAALATPGGDARDLLVARGLALDRRWWCRLPVPLTDGTTDPSPAVDWSGGR